MRKLMIRQLDQVVGKISGLNKIQRPNVGWIKTLREAFGMTAEQLGKRLHVSQQRVSELEKNEVEGIAMLKSIKAAAEALECEFVYFLIPKSPIGKILKQRAEHVAKKHLSHLTHSMELEAQGVSNKERYEQITELAQELLNKKPKELWDEL